MWEQHGCKKEVVLHFIVQSFQTRWQPYPVFEWQGSTKEKIQWLSYNRLQMSSMFQHHMISTWQLLRLSKLTWEGIHVNFQSWKNIIIIPTALERTVMLFYWKNKSQRGQQISVQLNQLQDQQITGHLDFYKVRFLKSSHCWYCLWIWWSKWRVQVTDFMNIS